MNPYEPPQTADERIPAQSRRKLIVALSLAVAAGMIIGGMAMFFMVRIQTSRAMRAELIRARRAAEGAELRARRAASEAERQPKHEQ